MLWQATRERERERERYGAGLILYNLSARGSTQFEYDMWCGSEDKLYKHTPVKSANEAKVQNRDAGKVYPSTACFACSRLLLLTGEGLKTSVFGIDCIRQGIHKDTKG